MANKKFYAVRCGRVPGIYETWEDCKKQVMGFSSASYKSFPTREEAEAFVSGTFLDTHTSSGEKALQECTTQKVHSEADVTKAERMAEEKGSAMRMSQNMDSHRSDTMVAYVDGSYNQKTKKFSYGMVILYQGTEECFSACVDIVELASMRNVAGEIKGAEAAMRYALEKGASHLVIYHDYEGIAKWCTGEWKANKEGTKAYRDYFLSVKDSLWIEFVKVKGHSNDHYNDMADALAKREIF